MKAQITAFLFAVWIGLILILISHLVGYDLSENHTPAMRDEAIAASVAAFEVIR